jgi:hypothetical protein
MIKLDTAFVTTDTSVIGGVQTVASTDTLRVSYVELNLIGGSVMAMVERGTLIDSVFTPNMFKLRIELHADGNFSSTDGSWKGSVPAAVVAGFVQQLRGAFEAFVLGAGAVTGTAS